MNFHSTLGFGTATDLISALAHAVALVFNAAAVTTIVLVSIAAIGQLSRQVCGGKDWASALLGFRTNVGRGVLLGLELLVAADIVGTIAVTPTFDSLGILGLIIAIRTFLSVSLTVEIEGNWPWRRRQP